ncbi:MAG: diguanylate cyclase, partial [Eubacterium sp.]|nr:diguanylate cyclase [Eubacterium sp.]
MSDKYMKIKKWLWLFSVIFLVIAVYKSFGIDRLSHKIAPSTIHVTEIGWTGCTQIDEETWDYTYRLPTLISSDQIVSVATYWVGVNVYVDQTLVFSYNDFEHEKGACRQWIRMPLWAAGRTLHVVYHGEYDRVQMSAKEEAYIGNAALVYFKFVQERIYAVIFAVVVVLMLALLAYFYRLMNKNMNASLRREVAYLALFMLATGIWIICDSQILFVLMTNTALNVLLSYSALILFPMFLTMFVSEAANHRQPLLDFFPLVHMTELLIVIGGYLTGIVTLDHSLKLIHLMLVVTVIVNVCCSVLEVYRNRNQEMRKVLLGFVGFSICGVIALVIYWNSPTMNYAVVYCAGLTIFLMFVLWAAYERLYLVLGHNAQVMAYKELAYKDVMTNLGNRAAFMNDSKQLERAHSPGIIVMDVNNLKTVNDCYGHQEGDLMICNASECIARAFEGKGTAYRIGGDEFVILLEKTTEAH